MKTYDGYIIKSNNLQRIEENNLNLRLGQDYPLDNFFIPDLKTYSSSSKDLSDLTEKRTAMRNSRRVLLYHSPDISDLAFDSGMCYALSKPLIILNDHVINEKVHLANNHPEHIDLFSEFLLESVGYSKKNNSVNSSLGNIKDAVSNSIYTHSTKPENSNSLFILGMAYMMNRVIDKTIPDLLLGNQTLPLGKMSLGKYDYFIDRVL